MNQPTREHVLKDGRVITQKLYTFEDGLAVWCPERCCVFCKYCRDIWYDYGGPYMFLCKKDETGDAYLTENGYIGECELFVEDEADDNENHEVQMKT